MTNESLRTQAREALIADGLSDDEAARVVTVVAPVYERQIEQRARKLALHRRAGA